MAGARKDRGASGRGFLITLLVLVLSGCSFSTPGDVHIPANLRTPTVAGVVVSETRLANGHWRNELADGQTFEVDYDETASLLGGPHVGRLLLAGTDETGQKWVAGIVPATALGRPSGCYELVDQGRANADWIETESGFRLQKAATFHSFGDDPKGVFSSDRGVFCLDTDGEVTSYEPL